MALPKRIRDQLREEGRTLEDEVNDIENGTGSFGLNEAIQNNEIPVTIDEDGEEVDDEQDVQASADPAADPAPAPTSDEDDPAPAPVDVQTPAPTDQASDTPPSGSETYINPFDIDLEDDPEPGPQPQPQPQPEPRQEQPAPQSRPVPQPTSQQGEFQFTPEEVRALGGPQQAAVMQTILSRFVSQQTEDVRQGALAAQVEAFRNGIASTVPQYREIITSRAWKKYLQTYSPLAGKTIQEALLEADGRFDRRAVLGIFESFRQQYAPKGQTAAPKVDASTRPKPADLATPSRSATNNSGVTSRNRKYKFKESDVEKFDHQRRTKKIDSVTYHDKVAAYNEALKEGKVELGA